MDKKQIAINKGEDYFLEFYNCCEATLLALLSYFDLNLPELQKLCTPFGGGIGGCGNTCGALNAAAMAIGLKYGRIGNREEDKALSVLKSRRIYQLFKEAYGSTNCWDITEIDFTDPEDWEEYKRLKRNNICVPLVKKVIQWVIEEEEGV